MNQRLSVSLRFGRDGADEMMAMAQQQKEMTQYNKTLKTVYMYIHIVGVLHMLDDLVCACIPISSSKGQMYI